MSTRTVQNQSAFVSEALRHAHNLATTLEHVAPQEWYESVVYAMSPTATVTWPKKHQQVPA